MSLIYAIGPGTTSGGDGTSPTPYTHIHEAMAACSPGDTLIVKPDGGIITQSMAWNSMAAFGGWKSGTLANPINIIAEGHTNSTTRGVSPGTSSVIWQPTGGGGALNISAPSNVGHINFNGFVFDASYLNVATAAACISLNNDAHDIHFRNCTMQNTNMISGANSGLMMEFSQGTGAIARNNSVQYCRIKDAHPNSSHFIYLRSHGNFFLFNDFSGGAKAAIQLFAGSSYSINDNVIAFNWFHDFPDTGIDQELVLLSAKCSRNLIHTNVFWDCPTRVGVSFAAGSGISGTSADNTAIHNTFRNMYSGVKIRPGSVGLDFLRTVVKNNLAYVSTYQDYQVEGNGTDTVFLNNSDGQDPLFTNPGADDFTLQAGSPYKTSGMPLSAPYTVDMNGVARPQNVNPSLGAYEYDSGGLVTLAPVNVPGQHDLTVNTPEVTPMQVTDDNDPALLTDVIIYLDKGTWTDVDLSGGAMSI